MSFVFKNADILLPKQELDHTKWSVVACDQFTSEPEYWRHVVEQIEDAPSTYHMILPEVYLEDPDVDERLGGIKDFMQEYMDEDVFDEYKDAMIYVERTDSCGKVRAGIVGAIDLEAYDYRKGSDSLVRATEATVISRIPPRIRVRKSAVVELPHIMILIDDPEQTVIEPMAEENLETVYDFDLMLGGGHLKGGLLDSKQQEQVTNALKALGEPEHFQKMYGVEDAPVLLFAMGDGNHSLATAKEFYEQLKAEHPGEDLSDHPARYALVEIVNLHSPALEFEAIHRIVTNVDADDLMARATEVLGLREDPEGSLTKIAERELKEADGQVYQQFLVVRDGRMMPYNITKELSKLSVGSLQKFLDQYLEENGGKIDYIHGFDVLVNLTKQPDSIGFVLADMGKDELFPTVIADGALPRKTFSMGHAQDKRYYMECRKIVK